MRSAKGHGTENDFVLVDGDDLPELTAGLARALCDRRAGVGADGVLRVDRREGHWFMDFRNADGSLGETCGNGIRVFARYLVATGRAEPGALEVGTRAGLKQIDVPALGDITVDMGAPRFLPDRPVVAGVSGVLPGTAISMGNPHVVVVLDSEADLAALDLNHAPVPAPALAGGQNVEYVVRTGPRSIAMRVHERGVGETRSCGTGTCAAVAAVAGTDDGARDADWAVSVPGGQLGVRWTSAGSMRMTGPAVLIWQGTLDEQWYAAAAAG
ncbi:MAG: diaminopimelate epimerase [Mycobacteriales bacterium]